jgi:hypothetical protein
MESNGRSDKPPLPIPQDDEGGCTRCGGLMIMEYYLDLEDDTGQIGITGLRCTSCGDVIDSVILRNRLSPTPDLLQGVKQRKYAQRFDHGEAES